MDVPWRTLVWVLRAGHSAMLLLHDDGRVRWGNRAARRLFADARLRTGAFSDLFSDSVAATAFLNAVRAAPIGYSAGWRTLHRHRDGWVQEFFVEASRIDDPEGTGILVTVTSPPVEMLETDSLTGCRTRRALDRDLAAVNGVGCLAFADLDGMKSVNETYGHVAGDMVLIHVADRLRRSLAGEGAVYRIGGDEFAIVLNTPDVKVANNQVRAALHEMSQPVEVQPGIEKVITAGVGIVSLESKSRIEAMREADIALYHGKAHGPNTVVVGSDLPEWARDRRSLVLTAANLAEERDRLAELARTDPLTELANRLALNEDSFRLFTTSRRNGRPYSVLFVDIDLFHHYNKNHGDAAGDKALIEVGRIMQSVCRSEDRVFRKGGEEFIVLLPETSLAEAAAIAERLRLAVFERQIPHEKRPDGAEILTVVVGVAESEEADQKPEQVWERAAAPLMAVKRDPAAPRNCVRVHGVQG